jgi:ABC-2 type transport system permease protein
VSENTQGVEVTVPSNAFSLTMPTFTVWFAFFIVGAVAQTLLSEREEGTLRRLVAAPISRGAIIVGKMLAYLVIAVLQVLLIFGIGNVVFDMSLGHSPLGLLLITVALGLTATSLGMMLAGLARSARQADGIGMVLGFVLAGLGGCLGNGLRAQYRQGGFLGTIAQFTPHAHGLEAYRRLLLEGGSTVDILPQFAVLLAMSVAFFLVAWYTLRFE